MPPNVYLAAPDSRLPAVGAKIGAKTIFTGFGIGLAYKTAMAAFRSWKDVPEKVFGPPFAAGSVAAEVSPELLGVGYSLSAAEPAGNRRAGGRAGAGTSQLRPPGR